MNREDVRKVLTKRTEALCAGIAASTNKQCLQYAKVGSIFCGYHGADKSLPTRYIAPRDAEAALNDLCAALGVENESATEVNQ